MVVAIASLAYPSVTVPTTNTVVIAETSSYTSGYSSAYTKTTTTGFLTLPYSTSTVWSPGDPICDPRSLECHPYPTTITTYTYSSTATYYSRATTTSVWSMTSISQVTVLSKNTYYQNVPVYAASGLSDSQFAIVAILILGAGVSGLLLVRKAQGRSKVNQMRGSSETKLGSGVVSETGKVKQRHFCMSCGTELLPNSAFCGRCGTKQR